MNEIQQKAEAFAKEYAPGISLRLTESELKLLRAHLQVAYSVGYRDASIDCAEIVKATRVRPTQDSIDGRTP